MRESRNADIGIIQAVVDKYSKIPEEKRGFNERIIVYLWKFIKSKTKYKLKHNDKWLHVEEEYIKEMAGKITRKELEDKFKHRSEEAVIKKIERMKLLDKFK